MARNPIKIIGVDCAVDRKKVGMAVGLLENGRVRLLYPPPGPEFKWSGAGAGEIVKWIEGDDPVLLAFDAPLGWPRDLAPGLANHHAGDLVVAKPDKMFHRKTDDEIKNSLKLRPLEVGADKIARTAHAALKLLDEIRGQIRLPIPLAWEPDDLAKVNVIEVYPAGTLLSHGLEHRCYKGTDSESAACRHSIIQGLRTRMDLPRKLGILGHDADVLDAVVCVLAGVDFMTGLAAGPSPGDLETAKKEGWIWVRRTNR